VRLIPWNRTLVGWDEWILAGIATRLGCCALPSGQLYEILVPTGYSYPPFPFWLSGALVYCFGPGALVWRLPTILSDGAAVAMVFVLARRVGGTLAGWTAGLLAWSTLYLAFHDTVTLDFLLSFWVLASCSLVAGQTFTASMTSCR